MKKFLNLRTNLLIFFVFMFLFNPTTKAFADAYIYKSGDNKYSGWYYKGDGDDGKLWPLYKDEGEKLHALYYEYKKDGNCCFRKLNTPYGYYDFLYLSKYEKLKKNKCLLLENSEINFSCLRVEGSIPYAVKSFVYYKLYKSEILSDRKEREKNKAEEQKQLDELYQQKIRQWRQFRGENVYLKIKNHFEKTYFNSWCKTGKYNPDIYIRDPEKNELEAAEKSENLIQSQKVRQWRQSRNENLYKHLSETTTKEKIEFRKWVNNGNFNSEIFIPDPLPESKAKDCSVI